MTLADGATRPKQRSLTPWVAGLVALAALGLLLWAVLGGGRGEPGRDRVVGARRAPTVGAVEAAPLQDMDMGPLASLGGPGSAVSGEQPYFAGGAAPAVAAAPAQHLAARARRAPRRERRSAPSASPGYRVIGPGAASEPAAEPSSTPPPPAEE